MNILQDLWYGNLEPSAFPFGKSDDNKQYAKQITDAEKAFMDLLNEDQIVQYEKIMKLWLDHQSFIECEIFSYAFSLGAKTIMAVFNET